LGICAFIVAVVCNNRRIGKWVGCIPLNLLVI